jgi:hypothetical protein
VKFLLRNSIFLPLELKAAEKVIETCINIMECVSCHRVSWQRGKSLDHFLGVLAARSTCMDTKLGLELVIDQYQLDASTALPKKSFTELCKELQSLFIPTIELADSAKLKCTARTTRGAERKRARSRKLLEALGSNPSISKLSTHFTKIDLELMGTLLHEISTHHQADA